MTLAVSRGCFKYAATKIWNDLPPSISVSIVTVTPTPTPVGRLLGSEKLLTTKTSRCERASCNTPMSMYVSYTYVTVTHLRRKCSQWPFDRGCRFLIMSCIICIFRNFNNYRILKLYFFSYVFVCFIIIMFY